MNPLDFYAPPLFRKAEAAAAPGESFGFQPGLVALALQAVARLLCASKPAGLRLDATKNPLTVFVYIQIENSINLI